MDELTGIVSIITNGGTTAALLVFAYLVTSGRLISSATVEAIVSQAVSETVNRFSEAMAERDRRIIQAIDDLRADRYEELARRVAEILRTETPLPPNRQRDAM